MDRIKIGITQGDINGVGYELILKTFQIEEMASLCTPIIYGSPKVATYHRKAINNQTSFQVVESANMAKDGRLNMINCFEEEEQKKMNRADNAMSTAQREVLECWETRSVKTLVEIS